MSVQPKTFSDATCPQLSSIRWITTSLKFRFFLRTLATFSVFGILVQLLFVIPRQYDYSQRRVPWYRTNKIQTVFVVSHRRSGTHLTMDLLSHIMSPPFRVVKANHAYLTESASSDDLKRGGINCNCFNYMRKTGKIVHAYRDVRDVVTSMYYYYRTYNPGFMKGVTKKEYFQNKGGVRNKVIETWVNTTGPWFMHDDIFQLQFTDAVSGYEYIYDKIALFLGYRMRGKVPSDPRTMSSPSKAVAKLKGRGDHGYKDDMSLEIANEVLAIARSMQNEKRRLIRTCSGSYSGNNFDNRNTTLFGAPIHGFWIGGSEKYGLFAPNDCSAILETSQVVYEPGSISHADLAVNYTDVLT